MDNVPVRLALVNEGPKRLFPLQAILELRQQQFPTTSEQGARGVAVICRPGDLAVLHQGYEVGGEDGGLGGDGGGRLVISSAQSGGQCRCVRRREP